MILRDEHRAALQYVQAANSGGYRPTIDEVDEWRLRPDPLPGKRGKLISPAVAGEPSIWAKGLIENTRMLESFAEALRPSLLSMGNQLLGSAMFGTPGTPARYEPDGPPEAFLASLIRLSWLASDDRGGLSTTPLSRALLRAEEVAGQEAADVLVLAEGDPLAYASLLGHVAEMGQVLVVDPYLKPEQLLSFLQHTNANRFLIGSRANHGSVVAMQTLLSATGWQAVPELKQTAPGELHDRYIIGDTHVYTLGMSLNAVGRSNTTVLMPLPEDAADHIRSVMEQIWSGAETLGNIAAPSLQSPSPEHLAAESTRVVKSGNPRTSTTRKRASKKVAAKKPSAKGARQARARDSSPNGDDT
ncbi:hypothetical protein KMZ32_16800 [Phycicoccus sp. MAQZ13P-2]|uniref:hypothetical protein n=1 Tax=Phycicoccus mangrovi TaxID=2840470 RepID=UPI001C000DEA|nr:hypothetical protein [Phycicoccus mangrovi]MBT9257387.1 hypothetical protein [Phycicoccus mangrovi]MBT9275738.1 hypothetical protein [Phycicoccus mangrovi]